MPGGIRNGGARYVGGPIAKRLHLNAYTESCGRATHEGGQYYSSLRVCGLFGGANVFWRRLAVPAVHKVKHLAQTLEAGAQHALPKIPVHIISKLEPKAKQTLACPTQPVF